MKRRAIDIEKLRVALRWMSRGNLLMAAERAIEIVPSAKLGVLVGGVVRLDQLPRRKAARRPVRGSQAALLERTYVS